MDARTAAGGAVDWLRLPYVRGRWHVLALGAVTIVLAGCQTDPNMQLVERELRLQDSHIFELEEHLADCHSAVAAYRREIASLRRQLEDDGETPPDVDPYKDWDPDTRLRPPRSSGPSLPEIDEGDEIPYTPQPAVPDAVTPLEEFDAPAAGEPPAPLAEPPGEGVSFPRPAEVESPDIHNDIHNHAPLEEELPRPNVSGASEIEQIGLRLMVRYHTAEDTPLELQTLVEPQDARSQQVLAEGDISLMVVSKDGGPEQPLARWDFSEEEARGRWRRSRLGTGILFQLPWPGTPQPGSYRLWARMVGEDGQKYLSSADFEVQEAGLANRPAREPQPIQVAELEPEPSEHIARPSRSETPATSDPEAPGQTAQRARPEPSPGASANAPENSSPKIAWKASVEAARLPRLPKPAAASIAATDESATQHASNDGRLIPWSPERPDTSGIGLHAASEPSDWLPYR